MDDRQDVQGAVETGLAVGEEVVDDRDVELLRSIAEHGSIHAAANELERSYAHAQRRVVELEEALGPLVERRRGGSDGGGSSLTDGAQALLERFDRLEENLEIITGLWQTPLGEEFDYEGTHFRLSKSPALPKPVQHPRPPIIIGGSGKKRTPALAARFADEFNVVFQPLDVAGDLIGRVRTACVDTGRDPESLTYSAALVLCCGRDEAEFRRRAEAIGREPDELRENGAAGTPDEVAAKIATFGELGVTRMYLQTLDLSDLDHLELVASKVAPQLA